MKQTFKLTFKALLGFLVLWATFAHAEVRIEITEGVDSARPIGVVPFKWTGAAIRQKKLVQLLLPI